MKNLSKITILSLALASVASNSFAATVIGQGTASAQVVSAPSILQTTPLNFGQFVSGSGGAISSDGTPTGNVTAVNGSGAQHGKFSISNPSGGSLINVSNITLTDSIGSVTDRVTLTRTGSTETMKATLSKSGSNIAAGVSGELTVSGTLTVGSSQVLGTYNGAYNVAVNYQ